MLGSTFCMPSCMFLSWSLRLNLGCERTRNSAWLHAYHIFMHFYGLCGSLLISTNSLRFHHLSCDPPPQESTISLGGSLNYTRNVYLQKCAQTLGMTSSGLHPKKSVTSNHSLHLCLSKAHLVCPHDPRGSFQGPQRSSVEQGEFS